MTTKTPKQIEAEIEEAVDATITTIGEAANKLIHAADFETFDGGDLRQTALSIAFQVYCRAANQVHAGNAEECISNQFIKLRSELLQEARKMANDRTPTEAPHAGGDNA